MSCSDACRSKCPPPGANIKLIKFTPADFPFVTTVPDDGTDKGGGWQVAKVNLKFEHVVAEIPPSYTIWYCSFNIEMPLRNHVYGKISASRAAGMSIDVTEGVAVTMDFKLPQGIFCSQFIKGVKAGFPAKYPLLGERVYK